MVVLDPVSIFISYKNCNCFRYQDEQWEEKVEILYRSISDGALLPVVVWQPHPNEDLDRWGILTTITVIFVFSKNHWHPKVMICFQVQHKNGYLWLKSKWERVKVICVSGETSLNLTWALLMTGWAAFGHLYVTHQRGGGGGGIDWRCLFLHFGFEIGVKTVKADLRYLYNESKVKKIFQRGFQLSFTKLWDG